MIWLVTEKRNGRLVSKQGQEDRPAAIEYALDLADEVGLLYEKGKRPVESQKWTRDELRTILDRTGQYEDGEVTVSIEPDHTGVAKAEDRLCSGSGYYTDPYE